MNSGNLSNHIRIASTVEITHERLGPLSQLTGTWVGTGFNLIALPNFHNENKPLPFFLKLNTTREMLTVNSMGGPIPNRGLGQDDIFYVGVHYLQQISDAVTNAALHLEPGMWLNLPSTTSPEAPASLARLATIPHGDALLATGPVQPDPISGAPDFQPEDSKPFTLNANQERVNESDNEYLAPYLKPENLPPGITSEIVLDPNLLLKAAISNQVIKQHTILKVSANPVGGINGTTADDKPTSLMSAGMLNIPFINKNANANGFAATFWIEEVDSGNTDAPLLQLQYSQTVLLEFLDIKWPHISVATLVKQ